MEKHTMLIAPYPNRSMGLVLKCERKCKAVWNSSHVSEALPSHYIVNSEKKNTNLHVNITEIQKKQHLLRQGGGKLLPVVPPQAAQGRKSVCMFLKNSFLAVRLSALVYLLLCRAVIEVGLMVPRRIGDVSCGENHTVWQTQRRHEESSSHPCSLQQWSHQRLLTCFHLVLPNILILV